MHERNEGNVRLADGSVHQDGGVMKSSWAIGVAVRALVGVALIISLPLAVRADDDNLSDRCMRVRAKVATQVRGDASVPNLSLYHALVQR